MDAAVDPAQINVVERYSFDAWGNRRSAETASPSNLWTGLTPGEIAAQYGTVDSTTRQGFTGHEMLDRVGLIHMNARLYDPMLGRFIQADTMVEDDATQGLNRYSYCLNNPLSRTDPSGNLSFRQVLGLAVGIAFAIISQQYWAANALWASFATAVGGGFASAYIATGSLKAGLWGALSAAVFWGIGTGFSKTTIDSTGSVCKVVREASGSSIAKVAAHAAAGGTLNVLQGGKFGHGFLSAGVTEGLSPAIGAIGGGKGAGAVVGGTIASAVVGGTVSELSGGKFANGAQTGAFQFLFNRTVHEIGENRARDAYVDYDGDALAKLKAILARAPAADGTVHMSYEEFSSILDFHAGYIYRLGKALGGFGTVSNSDWGEVLYFHGDSIFFGSESKGGFGGTAFTISGAPQGMPFSGVGGDINYVVQGMLASAGGTPIAGLHATLRAWNNFQGSPDRFMTRVYWAEAGYRHYGTYKPKG